MGVLRSKDRRGISVVMPSYNAAEWLEATIGKIEAALLEANFGKKDAEIVIVDDGSKDDTKKVVDDLKKKTNVPINYIYQKNSGRYLARKTGVGSARFDYVWFVDTRVHVEKKSLKYAFSEIRKSKKNAVWNAHVHVHKKGNIIARFMDAITFIGWRRYFKKPRRTSYGLKEFDYYPKGTTSFLVPKTLIEGAMEEFEQDEHDMQRSSDDTHLIRIISREHRINLSPDFSCRYHARNTFSAFRRHSFHRGQVFIDGFFRPGTRFYVPIIAFLVISLVSLLAFITVPAVIPFVAGALIAFWIVELIAAILLGVPLKDALSLFILTPLFAVCYGAGLWVAFLKLVFKNPAKRKSIISIVLALLFFTICTAYFYLGKSALSCGDMLASGPGDQIGLVWLNTMTEGPLWGWSTISNAPFGESVQSPVHITGAIEYFLFWFFSLFTGPICGYNLFTSLSFIFSAMIVFLFVRHLTNRSDVALFAGFAATFTPYLQIKTGVHPSYALFGVFVLAIWLIISLWNRPTKVKAAALGLTVSSFFFIDPYFILLGGVTVLAAVGVFIGRLVYLFVGSRQSKKEKKYVIEKTRAFLGAGALAAGIAILCGATPLIITNVIHGAQINSEVGSVRSDIKVEIMHYSARPFEYLLPNASHPLFGTMQVEGVELLTRKPHGSNPAEDTLALSYVVVALSIASFAGVLLYSRGRLNKSLRPVVRRRYVIAVAVFAVVGFVAFLTSFPARTHGLIFPSEIISDFIQIWRVYSRMAVIVMFSLAIIAAIGLAILTHKLDTFKRWLIAFTLIVVVGIEFLTFAPWNDNRGWSYSQAHPFYSWLKDQDDIKVIAEYPFNEPGMTNVTGAYFRDQYIHNKKTVNAYAAANAMAPLRNSLRDLTDPQTVPALAYLGVDLVVVHVEDSKQVPSIPGLVEVDWNKSPNDNDSIYAEGQLKAYRVASSKDTDGLIVGPGGGFLPLVRINSTYTEAGYVFEKNAALKIYNLKTGLVDRPSASRMISFTATADVEGAQLIVKQLNTVIWEGTLEPNGQAFHIDVDTSKPIELGTAAPGGRSSVVISNLDLN